jgi:hypothetical protein
MSEATMLSSADWEWRELATAFLRGHVPQEVAAPELHRLDRKARRQEIYHARQLRLAAERAELEPDREDAARWSPELGVEW